MAIKLQSIEIELSKYHLKSRKKNSTKNLKFFKLS